MMNNRPTHSQRLVQASPKGFTIIELVVAMGVASIMIFMINRIFFDTTNAVSRGVGLSQIIGESRAFSSTLTTDFASETGQPFTLPADGGFLFIGFKQYNNVDFPHPRRLRGDLIPRSVTSDQILAVINTAGQNRTPLTPASDDTFSPYSLSTNHALLWYGHVSRLRPDGADGGELTAGSNPFGHQWIVGRQLMFLADPATLTPPAAPFNIAHADSPFSRGSINNYNLAALPTAQRQRWMGLSDILNVRLDDLTSPAPTHSILDPVAPLTTPAYAATVARMAYVTERLRVAVAPNINAGLPSWNMAQTHPAFMSNCSDFQISFAGDFDTTTGIDVEDDYVGSGTPSNPEYRGGNIKWYGWPANIPGSPGYDAARPSIYPPTATETPAFFTGATGDPIFITDTTLLPEINSQITPNTVSEIQVDRAVIFRHDVTTPATETATKWPRLIRIRYLLHDERGEIESTVGDGHAQGIWFEQIIRVQ